MHVALVAQTSQTFKLVMPEIPQQAHISVDELLQSTCAHSAAEEAAYVHNNMLIINI